MKKIIYILGLITISYFSYCQQLPIYSQYLFNQFLINPAVAGSDGYTSFNITARQQWVGLTGAPELNSLSFQTRMLKRGSALKTRRNGSQVFRPQTDGRVGLGGYIYSYRSGLIQRSGFQAAYVFHTWIESSTQLSLSMGITGYHLRILEEEVDFEIQNDPVLADDLRRGIFVPDATFGLYILNAKYSLGFSADQMMGGIAKIGSKGYSNYKMSRHFYLMGSYSYFYGREVEIKPSFLLKMSEQLKPQLDVGLTYYYDNFKTSFWAGLYYRTGGALVPLIGVRTDHIYLGYAFDFSLHEIQRFTYGTHEITLAVKLGDSARKYRWLDRY